VDCGFEMLVIGALAIAAHGGLAPVCIAEQESRRSEAGLKAAIPAEWSGVSTGLPAGRGAMRFQPAGLSMVRPYVAGKVPVVFVHGLWGNARNWAAIIRALEADPFLSDRYQALTFGYSGGSSITYSAYQLRRDLQSLRDRLDAEHEVHAWDRTILIGHSMGGLLCKMMAQDSGSKLWDLMARRPFEKLAGPRDARDLLRGELVYEPVALVRRLIFVATPHRGSRLVCRPVTDIGSRLVAPPERLRRARAALLASNGPDAFTPNFLAGRATSLDQLTCDNPLLLAIDGLPIDPDVKRHSIIAELGGLPGTGKGDGLVSYASAHHVGATSELIVNAGHVCLENPEVIREVARILKEHATP
jgi:pimeloyl-ACP methyl ester carboxylesterase